MIYIIGSGAIGKVLAVFLKEANKKVVLVRGSVDNEPEQKTKILVTNQNGRQFQQEVSITSLSNLKRLNGIVLVATKTFSNFEIAQKLKNKEGQFSIVLLQNGLNIEEAFEGFNALYRCVLFSTSQITDKNKISFKTVAESLIGKIGNRNIDTEEIVRKITTPYFEFRSEVNIEKYIWNKVIINCAYNSICPLLETDNGIFQRNEDVLNLAKEIITECIDLAKAYGMKLDKNEIEEKLLFISQRAEGQLISTYEDIRRGRKTEIDNLNLEIARMADEIGKPSLVTRTRLLGKMISAKSAIHMDKINALKN